MNKLPPEELRRIALSIDEETYCARIAKAGTEHAEQRAFFAWLQLMENRQTYPLARMAYAIPNGGKRDPVTAARLKAEGVKSGVPDICWPVPIGAAGLYIEMKVKGGATSDSQDLWHTDLRALGYIVAVCWGWRQARQCFIDYAQGASVAQEYK